MAGRPKKYTKKRIEEYRQQMEEYIENEDIPSVAEFCYKYDIRRQRVYEFIKESEAFSDTVKKLYEKGEAQLVKLGLLNVVQSSMAIFCLKQKPYLYTDKWQEHPDFINKDEEKERLDKLVYALEKIADSK